jgi:hypothetical protein
MKTYVHFRDIEKAERKRLAAEAVREPRLRATLFAAIVVPSLLSGPLANCVVQGGGPLARVSARFVAALVLAALIWEVFGRHRFRAAVEKLKNA